MKKTIFTFLSALLLFVFANQTLAQVPQGFNYQAVARNSAGVVIANTTLGIKLSVHLGSASGTEVYTESHSPTTNQFGLFTVTVGQGSVLSGTFGTIDWSTGNYWLEVGLDSSNGTSYTSMGASRLLTVPYAMYAANSGTAGPIGPTGPTGPQGIQGPTGPAGTYTAGPGIQIASNVIKTNMNLSVSNTGDTLHLNPGNFVIIPGVSSVNTPAPYIFNTATSDVTYNSAKCAFSVYTTGFPTPDSVGIRWGTNQYNLTYRKSNFNTGGGTIAVPPIDMINLNANTTYYVQPYAHDAHGYYYGGPFELKTFTTFPIAPTVVTDTALGTVCTSTVLKGLISSLGGSPIIDKGFCYSITHPNPSISAFDDTNAISGNQTGYFQIPLDNLIPSTTYYYRAYVKTSYGYIYGTSKQFTTNGSYYAGFETGMPTGWTGNWAVSTDIPYENSYSLKSVNVDDSVQFTRTVTIAGQISFFHDCPSFYSASFYIDNVLQGTYGYEGWTIHTYPITAATHTFKWKNNSGGPHYIDYVIICP
jgi:hypothetical protein